MTTSDEADGATGARAPAARRRLDDDLARLRDAHRQPTGDPSVRHRRLEECHASPQRALADCSFHNKDLVSRRAAAMLSHVRALAAKARMPASASHYLPHYLPRDWQSEMRSLAPLAVKEGADGMSPRPDWDARSFWEGPEPTGDNWVELFRLRRHVLAHVDATGIRGLHGLPAI